MRENRTSGSEGGEPGNRHSPTPIGRSCAAARRAPARAELRYPTAPALFL